MSELRTIPSPIGSITGTVLGSTADRSVETLVIKGIPYASADRFGAPELITNLNRQATRSSRSEPLRGGFDATGYRAQCPQNPGTLERLLGGSSMAMDEECLHLNVFTPSHRGAPRPVLLWIHGGAFLNGSGSMPWYHGSSLAGLGDVVVITCNYRLGAFGFLGDRDLGLVDQLTVLEWVQRNVEAFGGDPDNVTVFGESAGGTSVLCLAAATRHSGLAHRFWAMSPSIPQIRSLARSISAQERFMDASAGNPALLNTSELLKAQAEIEAHRSDSMTAFSPTAGGALLAGPEPHDALATLSDDPRPLVIGSTRDEMQLFSAFDPQAKDLTEDQLIEQFSQRFGDAGPEGLSTYRAHRVGASRSQLLSALQTDETFRVTARKVAEAKSGGPVWSYWFCHPSTAFDGVLGACHGLDIPFAFSNLDRPGVEMFIGEHPQHEAVATEFSRRLLGFATNGDPGWEHYEGTDRATLQIGGVSEEPTGPVAKILHDPEPEIRELWEASGR
jgi:para-nitrobenzyl esterase